MKKILYFILSVIFMYVFSIMIGISKLKFTILVIILILLTFGIEYYQRGKTLKIYHSDEASITFIGGYIALLFSLF